MLALGAGACSAVGAGAPADFGAVEGGAPPDAARDATPVHGRITGVVVDLQSQPVAGASVALCGAPCQKVLTDAAGIYEFADVAPQSYSLRVELPGAAATDYGKVVIPIYGYDPAQTPVRALPRTVLPRLGAATALGAATQTVAIDSVLSLTVDPSRLTLPPGSGAAQLAGVRIPPALYPDFCLPSGDGRVLAEWALGPFAATSSASIDVHIADGLGLAPGSGVVLISVDPELGRPLRQGLGKVAADGRSIDSLSGMGVQGVTWLIVSLPGSGA
jgi:hypothetical protein